MGRTLLPTIILITIILPKIVPTIIITAEIFSTFITGKRPNLNKDLCVAAIITWSITSFYLLYITIGFKIEKDEAQKALANLKSQQQTPEK